MKIESFRKLQIEDIARVKGGNKFGTVVGSSIQTSGVTYIDVLWDGESEAQCDAMSSDGDSASDSYIGHTVVW